MKRIAKRKNKIAGKKSRSLIKNLILFKRTGHILDFHPDNRASTLDVDIQPNCDLVVDRKGNVYLPFSKGSTLIGKVVR
jgi:hypothetical protein